MLKIPASIVLAALRGSTYRKTYAFAPSLAAALLTAILNILWDELEVEGLC
jgi:hypothetical protein